MPLLDNLWSVVKGGVAGGLLQDDSDLLNTYIPQQFQQGMSDQEKQQYAQKIRSIGAAGLLSRGVDSQERTRAIQQNVFSDLLKRQQDAEQAQEKIAVSDYMSKLMQPTITPEMALGAKDEGRLGPTPQRANLIGAANPLAVGDANKARAMAYRQLAMQFDIPNPTKAEQYRKAAQMIDPTPEEYTLSEGSIRVRGDKTIASNPKAPDADKRRLTGAVGNLALTMFGSNDVGALTPQQLQAVDAEARKRKLEGVPSTVVNVGGEKAFESEVGKADAKFFSDVSATGLQAQRGLAQVNQLDALLRSTGGGLPVVAKQYAAQFGVKLGKDVGDIEAAQALINQLVPQQRPAGAGTMSDKDVELFKASLPNLIRTPGGNAKILATMRAMAQYDAQIGDIAQKAMAGEISRTQARAMMNQLQNPLSGFGLPAGVTVERVK